MRLLLVTAALLGIAYTFSIPFFGSEIEGPSLHPLSPALTDPAPARAKRQAYQVYVDGDSSVSVDKTGQSESGSWGPWTTEEQCSRTCGGGVQVEKRQCNGQCTGASVRYVSCNLDACEQTSDFRAEQCAKHNDDPLDGNYHKWLPYKGKNKCELLCKPEIGNFYYKWDEKVVDGTPCDPKGDDICVDGVCLPVGCDGKLGSEKKLDKCGKCDGDGSTCKTVEGFFDERNLSPGYHDVINLPVGATNIKIEEARTSSNNLALKNSSGHYYLNGNSMLQVEKDVDVAGTIFEYYDERPERISAKGPLKEQVTVSLLMNKNNKDSAIKYEFSIPLEEDVQYMYKPSEWTPCSVTCGKGEMTRTPYCVDTKSQSRVADDLCDENNATKPEYEKSCETVDCEAEWFIGDWEQCSQTCGDQGEQYRVVYCHQIFANGRRITVEDGNCTATRPAVKQQCNRFSCPEWQAGPWSACSEKCGDAHQYRSVTCRSEKEGEEGKLLPAESCDSSISMDTQRTCNLGPCEGLTFYTSEWKLCSKCNDTEETREVTCKDNMGRAYPLEKCLTDEKDSEIPVDTRTCATQQPCIYEWTASQWSKCSTECGHGHKTRRVVCAIHQLGDLEVVDEFHCQGEKPEEKEDCTNEEKCTGTWYTGPWGKCSEDCGGGKQDRMAVCLNYDKKPVPEWCDEKDKPVENQECNTDECPTCFDSEFGCCPDNSTFATGEFNQGCSNCSLSEFGCCADNVTEATGANSLGCPEFVESPLNIEMEGSGVDEQEEAKAVVENLMSEECKVSNSEGEEVSISCAAANATTVEEGELIANETTIHCSKTEFGCCPDWYTPAEGKNNQGCPDFVQGACNETKFGCCHDEVTLARGKNLEGCGEPSCAASLYGCCKDRKTIAFGPHYAGCERSSFPCELSQHGCCPDGETAALGKNGTGCGENCLTTKFGCCPDGATVAKGHHNEGCGCEYAQFGCCPDGKSAARGAGYYGCPDTCAQSQHGCCPDGETVARGANKEGCPCQYTRYGCCPDGETTALGAKQEGCDDCRYGKYGCCADGITKARGPNDQGCPSTTTPPFIMGGTVSPHKISSCALSQDQGSVCHPGYKLMWFYDMNEGRCSQFWYGGCGGNENRYQTKEMCETICIEPPAQGKCYLPKVEGPQRCDQAQARYYYDHTTKQCAAFWWRGCLGNSNNFASYEECGQQCKGVGPIEQTPAPVVVQPQPQAVYQPYEPQQPQEQEEIEVPAQRQEEWQIEPVTQAPVPEERPQMPTIEEVCRSNQDAGPCQDYSEQFFFNAFKGSCEKFTYGGCGGNLNRFRTQEECERRCGFLNPALQQQQQQPRVEQPRQEPVAQPQHVAVPIRQEQAPAAVAAERANHAGLVSSGKSRDSCQLKMDVGRCKGSFDSWFFEASSGSCVQFKYSGCGGNANRFATKEECEGLCAAKSAGAFDGPAGANSACDEPKETGSCTDFVTKWYYNKEDGTCNRFHYGGCKGTSNRFENEQACKAACSNHQDVCTLPKVTGPCSGKHTYYYFNSASNQCETFTYGGCLGNTNRFGTIEECQARCGQSSSAGRQLHRDTPQAPPTHPQTPPLNMEAPPSLSMPMDNETKDVNIVASSSDRCFLPKEVGRCRAAIVKYYYDSSKAMCLQFFFGGCGGNDNKFDTIEDCKSVCQPHQALTLFQADEVRPDVEEQLPEYRLQNIENDITMDERVDAQLVQEETQTAEKMDTQSESAADSMEMEEIQSDSAEETDANLQNMEREETRTKVPTDPRPVTPLPELCSLPEERGSCFDNILRWRFDSETGLCASFMYSGCDGNANHFSSEESCLRSCGPYRDSDVCRLPSVAGSCQQSVTKWAYDSQTAQCQIMLWSGCGGNANRFSSREECDSLCKEEVSWGDSLDVCLLPRSSGPCSDAVSMWFFDSASSECRPFTYGGCRGNGNRFLSKDACEGKCQPKSQNLIHLDEVAVCNSAFESGPCTNWQPKWYFDFATGQCRQFSYGGCGGNQNRFDSRALCLAGCGKIDGRLAEPVKARLTTMKEGPLNVGQEIVLNCEADGETPIVWYKDGNVLTFSEMVQASLSFDRVTISKSTPLDSGAYACAVGAEGLFSDVVHVKVNELLVSDVSCVDVGNPVTCSMIAKNNLCTKKRYGSFCCRTCSAFGLQ